ncbi:hypothetical protein CWI37_1560p0010 [Hamiltosporidium tvaerminnensis]|uniref:Uncharacterized protein n=1 Tax=Hamiltosporidium tvaerminnensis TaxID=1176355 RepID=A0A4Q9KVK3_9MICR|nr:hypothetical protein CWI37_1560p0010 [Hamiltosporidium tvaerminnensis]
MRNILFSLWVFIITVLCARNPVKSNKCSVETLFSIINKEIFKQYAEKTTQYDEISSNEFLLLESYKYMNTEATDEIFKFLLAKKSKMFQITVTYMYNDENDFGYVYHASILVYNNIFITIRLLGKYYRVLNKSIFLKSYLHYLNSDIKKYYLQKHISMLIFYYLNIFKTIFSKLQSKKDYFHLVPIFSDIVFFKDVDKDFLFPLLLKQKYKSGYDYYLLVNDVRINDKYDENKKSKCILEYAFTNTTFESIKNLSFRRVEIVTKSRKKYPHQNITNKFVATEIIICNQSRYLNIYDIFLSGFRDDIEFEESELKENEFEEKKLKEKKSEENKLDLINCFGYKSANIDIFTFIIINKLENMKKNKQSKKDKKNRKTDKNIQDIAYLNIVNREFDIEYDIKIYYKLYDNEVVDILCDQSITGFSSDMSLKEKISFIIRFVKDCEKYRFCLIDRKNKKSIMF